MNQNNFINVLYKLYCQHIIMYIILYILLSLLIKDKWTNILFKTSS